LPSRVAVTAPHFEWPRMRMVCTPRAATPYSKVASIEVRWTGRWAYIC
jgi:hypothetical protein